MKVQIIIKTDNAAFEDDPTAEVARILRELAKRIDSHSRFSPGIQLRLRGFNGNEVGFCTVTEG